MSRQFDENNRYRAVATVDGSVPSGAVSISFYVDGAGSEIDGDFVPEGGYTMPVIEGFYYPAIEYKPNGNTIYIRAFYSSPYQP
jgi:hypothetical protein